MREDLVSDLYALRSVGGDGQVEVFGHPGDDHVGDHGQAPCLVGLLLQVPLGDLAEAGEVQVAAQRVQALALVQLTADLSAVGLIG